MDTLIWEMDLNTATEFYRRCIERKAVTEDDKIAILTELAQEGRMKSVIQTKRSPDQIAEDMSKKFGDVLYITPKEKENTND